MCIRKISWGCFMDILCLCALVFATGIAMFKKWNVIVQMAKNKKIFVFGLFSSFLLVGFSGLVSPFLLVGFSVLFFRCVGIVCVCCAAFVRFCVFCGGLCVFFVEVLFCREVFCLMLCFSFVFLFCCCFVVVGFLFGWVCFFGFLFCIGFLGCWFLFKCYGFGLSFGFWVVLLMCVWCWLFEFVFVVVFGVLVHVHVVW